MLRVVGPEDVEPGLPQLQAMSDVNLADINVLVLALGYEDRATATLSDIAERHVTVDYAIVWEYPTNTDDNESNRPKLTSLLAEVGARVTFVCSHDELADEMQRRISDLPTTATIAVDFSVMTGRLALACMDVLSRTVDGTHTRVVAMYAEAAEYLPSRADFEATHEMVNETGSFGHDEGVLNVDTTANLRGSHDPQLRDLVLIIPGFSRDRVRAAISYVNPALLMSADHNVRWALSAPHIEKDYWREKAMRDIHGITDADQVNSISTFDYRAVYNYLETLFEDEWLESNLTIIFLGSKLQALAVGLFCIVRRGVRLVTSAPESYRPNSYTRGLSALWAVDFTDWSRTVRSLSEVGTVQFVD